MLQRRRDQIVAGVARQGLIDDEHPLCGVIDLDTLDELMGSLNQAYPTDMPALHTIAAKAITLRPDYDDAMAYLNLLYRRKADTVEAANERAELLKQADDLVDRVKEVKQKRASQPQPPA